MELNLGCFIHQGFWRFLTVSVVAIGIYKQRSGLEHRLCGPAHLNEYVLEDPLGFVAR